MFAFRSLPLALLVLCAAAVAAAADDAPQSAPATQPSERQPLTARVLEVHGDVQAAALGTADWKACTVDAEFPEATKFRTGLGGSLKLEIGRGEPYTAVVIEPVSLVALSEAWRSPTVQRVRMGVGYGQVRAGVAEGGRHSDFTVESPVVTLAKRGTWDFGMSYERGTERFEVFLLERGLVDAMNELTGERRQLLPGEAVTQAMRRWADEAGIRRSVPIADLLGQDDIRVAFNERDLSGLGVVEPGQGQAKLANLLNFPTGEDALIEAIRRLGGRRAEFLAQILERLPAKMTGEPRSAQPSGTAQSLSPPKRFRPASGVR